MRNHLRNDRVLAWMKSQLDNEHVQKFLDVMKPEVGDYLEYLEENSDDDASWTWEELNALKKGRLQ